MSIKLVTSVKLEGSVYRMKQEVVSAKTGHIGFGLSFNPARKKVQEFNCLETDIQRVLNGFVMIKSTWKTRLL